MLKKNKLDLYYKARKKLSDLYNSEKNRIEFKLTPKDLMITRSFVIGNPTWSNLIALNYKGNPVVGLANFPKLNKYYLNISKNNAFVIEGGKKRKLSVNKKVSFKNNKVAGAFHGWLSLPFILSGYLIQRFLIFSKNFKKNINLVW